MNTTLHLQSKRAYAFRRDRQNIPNNEETGTYLKLLPILHQLSKVIFSIRYVIGVNHKTPNDKNSCKVAERTEVDLVLMSARKKPPARRREGYMWGWEFKRFGDHVDRGKKKWWPSDIHRIWATSIAT